MDIARDFDLPGESVQRKSAGYGFHGMSLEQRVAPVVWPTRLKPPQLLSYFLKHTTIYERYPCHYHPFRVTIAVNLRLSDFFLACKRLSK